MNELELRKKMIEQGLNLNEAETIEQKALVFQRALKIAIKPKNQSDRTCFRTLTSWLTNECNAGRLDGHAIFKRVLDFALEASGPRSRNSAAVFMTILKKEIGYKK